MMKIFRRDNGKIWLRPGGIGITQRCCCCGECQADSDCAKECRCVDGKCFRKPCLKCWLGKQYPYCKLGCVPKYLVLSFSLSWPKGYRLPWTLCFDHPHPAFSANGQVTLTRNENSYGIDRPCYFWEAGFDLSYPPYSPIPPGIVTSSPIRNCSFQLTPVAEEPNGPITAFEATVYFDSTFTCTQEGGPVLQGWLGWPPPPGIYPYVAQYTAFNYTSQLIKDANKLKNIPPDELGKYCFRSGQGEAWHFETFEDPAPKMIGTLEVIDAY